MRSDTIRIEIQRVCVGITAGGLSDLICTSPNYPP